MFTLDKDQLGKLAAWWKKQDAGVAKSQKERGGRYSGAYYGAIGGAYTYSFTPTSLGCVVKVKNGTTGAEIDLTDYDSW